MNYIDLWVDCQARRLVNARGAVLGEMPVFVRGDDILLRVRFLDVDRSAAEPVVTRRILPAGSQLRFCGKVSLDEDAAVFSDVDAWTGPTNGEDSYYSCRANFADDGLLQAIGAKATIRLYYDISVEDPDGSNTTLLRFDADLLNDVHRGDESAGDAAPTYLTTVAFRESIPVGLAFVKLGDGRVELQLNGVPLQTFGGA